MKYKIVLVQQDTLPEAYECVRDRILFWKQNKKHISAYRLKNGPTFFEIKNLVPGKRIIAVHRFCVSKETFGVMVSMYSALENQEYVMEHKYEQNG